MCENTRNTTFSMSFHEFQRIFLTKISSSTWTNERTVTPRPTFTRWRVLSTKRWGPVPMGCDCRLFQARFGTIQTWMGWKYFSPLRIRKKTLKGRVSSFWGPIDTPTLSFWGSNFTLCRVEWSWGSVLFGGQKAYVHERKWKWLVCHIICCYILNQCDSTGSQRPFQSKVPLEWLINNPP